MNYSKVSAGISLGICILSSAMLIILAFIFPEFFKTMYMTYNEFGSPEVLSKLMTWVVPAFYCCVPFAAAALYMLIRLLLNIIKDKVFIVRNVRLLRFISWCCYAVMLITFISSCGFPVLIIIAFAMAVVGTLLRVVKNVMDSAVKIREENDLTI
ncbi:MAG: DUF2975 domain-containing protein [Clostridia bacterium]|nr:DUF2975 domain-containing protein [Clostridia bacterium]